MPVKFKKIVPNRSVASQTEGKWVHLDDIEAGSRLRDQIDGTTTIFVPCTHNPMLSQTHPRALPLSIGFVSLLIVVTTIILIFLAFFGYI